MAESSIPSVESFRTLPYRVALSALLRAAHYLASGIPRVMRAAPAQGFDGEAKVLAELEAAADGLEENLRALANAHDGIPNTNPPEVYARFASEVRHG